MKMTIPYSHVNRLVQDGAYNIHQGLARLHRMTNRWQHLGGRENDAKDLIIALRETAQKLHDAANEIEQHMNTNPTKVAAASSPERRK